MFRHVVQRYKKVKSIYFVFEILFHISLLPRCTKIAISTIMHIRHWTVHIADKHKDMATQCSLVYKDFKFELPVGNKLALILFLWFRASLIYINNCPRRCNTKQSIYYSASSLYMFRVSTNPSGSVHR